MMRHFLPKNVYKGMFIVAVLIVMSTLSFQVAYAHTASAGNSIAGPSIESGCLSYSNASSTVTYVAYIDANHYIHMHDVTNNIDYQSIQTSPTTPALACNSGQYPELAWKANDSTNKIWVGYFICQGTCGILPEDSPNPQSVPTDVAPALVAAGGTTLYLGWVSTSPSHHLYMSKSTDGGATWSISYQLTDYTRSGTGLSMAYNTDSGSLWFSWVASSGTPYLYLGKFDPNSTSFADYQLIDYGPFSDYSPYHASIAAYGFNTSGTSGETVAFVWKGSSNNNIYTGSWQEGWINTSSTSDTTYYAPAINRDYIYLDTAFTGTNTVVYYDL